jgi:hypothetical protein
VNGAITVPMTTCWADRHGTHTRLVDRREIDAMCVYGPDTRECYYVDPNAVGRTFMLRIAPAKNNVEKGVRWTRDHREMPPTVTGIPPSSPTELEGLLSVVHSSTRKRP